MSQLATLLGLAAVAAIVFALVQRARLSRVRLERAEIHQRLAHTERERTEADARIEREARERPRRERRLRGEVLEALLEIDDHVRRAATFSRTSDDIEGLRQGLDLLGRELDAVWRRVGLTRVRAEPGTPFDPAHHEAISRLELPADAADGATGPRVHECLSAGFMFADDDTVLRPARVVVAMPPTRPADAGDSEDAPEGDDDTGPKPDDEPIGPAETL